jgi:hypothetical protein
MLKNTMMFDFTWCDEELFESIYERYTNWKIRESVLKWAAVVSPFWIWFHQSLLNMKVKYLKMMKPNLQPAEMYRNPKLSRLHVKATKK